MVLYQLSKWRFFKDKQNVKRQTVLREDGLGRKVEQIVVLEFGRK